MLQWTAEIVPNRIGSGVFVLDGTGGKWQLPAMLRRLRVAGGGYAYHVLNRAVERMRIFRKERDLEALEKVIEQAKARLADTGFGVAGANDEATRPTIDATSPWSAVEIATRERNAIIRSQTKTPDPFTPSPKKKRKRKRKPGGQKGHPKHERPDFPPESIDETWEYTLLPRRRVTCVDASSPLAPTAPLAAACLVRKSV